MARSNRPLAVFAVALSIGACQATPSFDRNQPSLVLAPTLEFPLPHTPAESGILTVQLSGFLADVARKRVLATLADVDRVEVAVRNEGAVLQTVTVSKLALASGQATATFAGLPIGALTVTMTAFDAAGKVIGSAMRAVFVEPNVVTPLDMTLQLIPTPATPAPGGGGSSGLPSGGVAVNGTIVNGPIGSPTPASPGTVLSSFSCLHYGGFTAIGNRKLYVISVMALGSAMGAYSFVGEVSTVDGSMGWSHGLGQQISGNVAPIHGPYLYDRAHDVLWYAGMIAETLTREDTGGRVVSVAPRSSFAFAVDGEGYAYSPTSVLVSPWDGPNKPAVFDALLERKGADNTKTTLPIPAYNSVAFDSSGQIWAGWVPTPMSSPEPQASVRRYTAAGALIDTLPLPFVPKWMKPDSTGAMWVTDALPHGTRLAVPTIQAPTSQLIKVSPDGTVGPLLTLPLADFCVAPDDSVWIAGGSSVTKLTSTGETALSVPLDAAFISAADDVIYVGDGKTITTLAP